MLANPSPWRLSHPQCRAFPRGFLDSGRFRGRLHRCRVRGAGPQTIWANSYSNWGVPHSAKNVGKKLSALGKVTSSFSVTRPGGGAYETAYDIWADDNAYETMLWMNKQGAVGPLGTKQSTWPC